MEAFLMKVYSRFIPVLFLAAPTLALAENPKPNSMPPMGNRIAPVSAPAAASAPVQNATPVVDMAHAPEIHCAKPNYDFGNVDEGPDITHDFVFKNIGKGPLKITHVGTSCGCTAAVLEENGVSKSPTDSDPAVIPAGGRSHIKATYHTNGRPGHATKIITITSNDPKNPQFQMKLDMTVIREIDVQPDRIYLYNIHHGTVKDTPVTILGKPGKSFNVLSAEVTGTKVVTVSAVTSVNDDKDNRSGGAFTVTLPATQAIGSFTDEVTVKTDSPKKPEIKIPILGEVVGKVQYNPKQAYFQPHQDTPITVNFNPEDPKTFVIRRVDSEKHLVRAYVQKTASYNGDQYSVIIKPVGNLPADSDGKDKVTVWTNNDEQPQVSIDIQINK